MRRLIMKAMTLNLVNVLPVAVHSLLLLLLIVLSGCSSSRRLANAPVQASSTITADTVQSFAMRFDSVYVRHDSLTDRQHDTVYVHVHDVEYRYRMMRDTVRQTTAVSVSDSIQPAGGEGRSRTSVFRRGSPAGRQGTGQSGWSNAAADFCMGAMAAIIVMLLIVKRKS